MSSWDFNLGVVGEIDILVAVLLKIQVHVDWYIFTDVSEKIFLTLNMKALHSFETSVFMLCLITFE
jgi:hypothetical protein